MNRTGHEPQGEGGDAAGAGRLHAAAHQLRPVPGRGHGRNQEGPDTSSVHRTTSSPSVAAGHGDDGAGQPRDAPGPGGRCDDQLVRVEQRVSGYLERNAATLATRQPEVCMAAPDINYLHLTWSHSPAAPLR